MKLFYHPNSTYSRRVRIAALEKSIELELENVRMERLAHRRKEYLALNPMGRVPCLQDGDLALYESLAILEYLEELQPQPPLMPSGAAARARVRMYMQLSNVDFGIPGSTIYFPRRFLPESRWPHEAMKKAAEHLERHLAALAKDLQGRAYLCDEYSLADVSYAPFLEFRSLLGLEIPPAVEDWSRRLLERPAMLETRPPA
ncbi:MAG: glutathione S-transferase family protein [Leptospirales bacterium]|nr:glutathione S-transferase family protein [Leptospirales bacterium]